MSTNKYMFSIPGFNVLMATGVILPNSPSCHTSPNWPWPISRIRVHWREELGTSQLSLFEKSTVSGVSNCKTKQTFTDFTDNTYKSMDKKLQNLILLLILL